jgi:hypothetical protein
VPEEFIDRLGPLIDRTELAAEKARGIAELLTCERLLGARLIEARQIGAIGSLIIEVDVEVGQLPKYDIRRKERLATVFDTADRAWPEVLALRQDFPRDLSHLNLRPAGTPPSLCLSDQLYEEAKRRWTPAAFIAAIRDWLSSTARGDLHREDQPLEPFIMDFDAHLIIPQHLLVQPENAPNLLYGYQSLGEIRSKGGRPVYQLFEQAMGPPTGPPRFAAALFVSPPRQHGIIHHAPRTLAELTSLAKTEGFDLLALFKDRMNTWMSNPQCLDAIPILLIGFPSTRQAESPIERLELRAFALNATVRQIGERLDLWQVQDGKLGIILQPDTAKNGHDVDVGLLNPHLTLSRASAAELNRLERRDQRLVAIGAGALGSQVLMNLARSGLVASVIVDEDYLFPHNLAHHALTGADLGMPKAVALARDLRLVIDEEPAPVPMAVSALMPEAEIESLKTKLREADLILDMSASVAVARHLAIDTDSTGRRTSLFLNPSGSDLVLLSEDTDRTVRLDHLEMQYYWALATQDELASHLDAPERIRYARSCRDLSSRITNFAVTIHGGIGADAVHKIMNQPRAVAVIWRLDEQNCTVGRISFDVQPMRRVAVAGWAVLIAENVVSTLRAQRAAKLPNETGGVIIGDCDMQRRIVYLVGSLAAPPDSVEWPTHYIRGSRGLRRQVATITQRTDAMLRYVGEWHSHPDGVASQPSSDDQKAYAWLAEHMIIEGYPPVMLIIGQGEELCCVIGEQNVPVRH